MLALFSFIPTLFTILGDLPKVIQAIMSLRQMIVDAEATGLSGPDKLTKVLNDFEAALNVLAPSFGQPFATIAADVEAMVNALVADFNTFKKAV